MLNIPSRISRKQANFQVFRLGPSLNRLAGGFFFLNYMLHSVLERCGLAGLAGSLAGDLAGGFARDLALAGALTGDLAGDLA